MFNKHSDRDDQLDLLIDATIIEMQAPDNDLDARRSYLKEIERLQALKSVQPSKPWDPNIILTAATNITGILMILHHERANVIATKALSFVKKLS